VAGDRRDQQVFCCLAGDRLIDVLREPCSFVPDGSRL
jgi:hypothetical protein